MAGVFFALVDCNNFFVSCERIFRPNLKNKPVMVLSNNDGCIIARSDEVKKIGIKMGQPLHEVRDLVERFGISIFSANFRLYSDISKRVFGILVDYCPEIEIYSIDEAFLKFAKLPTVNLVEEIIYKIKKDIGVDVSIGIAKTKTLSKLANKFAKEHKIGFKFTINELDIESILRQTKLGDLWGIGKGLENQLNRDGVYTAYDLVQVNNPIFSTVVVSRIVNELRGKSALDVSLVSDKKKSLTMSRTLRKVTSTKESLYIICKEFTYKVVSRLHKQRSLAFTFGLYLRSSKYKLGFKNFFLETITLDSPSCFIPDFLKCLQNLINKVPRVEDGFKKIGVVLLNIIDISDSQKYLFELETNNSKSKLMDAFREISNKFPNKISFDLIDNNFVSTLQTKKHLSPGYTYRWSDLLTVK